MPTPQLDQATIKAGVIKELLAARRKQGFQGESIQGSTKPLGLERFDSQMGLVATIKIARALGIKIPPKVNVFVSKDGRHCLTVDESVARIQQNMQAA